MHCDRKGIPLRSHYPRWLKHVSWSVLALSCGCPQIVAQNSINSQPSVAPKFRILALAERGGVHAPYVDAAKVWLAQEAGKDGFAIDYIQDTTKIDDAFLAHYQLLIQLNYPPYDWTPTAMRAFESYIDEGKGGWIGFHHATLLGYFDGFDLWSWFSNFMGGIQFTNYIATFASAKVVVEDPSSPVMAGLGSSFSIDDEEWYTYDKSPRPNVHVLASVAESTYLPRSDLKMGDHPVVWTNNHVKARNVYIFMGHHAELFQDQAYTTLFHNAILWTARQ
ncbi:ThuA domain-containing protein [Acidipila sp. EB88]|uniref:ThuA domain-containing protein n=1 Tax=Acidipila sp. EB88 TaxID=2305226 RepID=UPI000F5E2C76|nr:ThuA domain-containing protein [Acidipila sp. EB88]RRA47648.1 ThuA domain-containing protein [Acidipila sp. EB88]